MPAPLQPERQRPRYCATVLPGVHPAQRESSRLRIPRPRRCSICRMVNVFIQIEAYRYWHRAR
jgi:hypothetical protein